MSDDPGTGPKRRFGPLAVCVTVGCGLVAGGVVVGGRLAGTNATAPTATAGVMRQGGMVMPAGMSMDGMTGDAMADMAAAEPARPGDPSAVGGTLLRPTVAADGTKRFTLTAGTVRWRIAPGRTVDAMGYNGLVPGPELRVTAGDRLQVTVRNRLTESTTVHWHGLDLPNEMDGVPGLTQDPIPPGRTDVYEFTVDRPGTFFYHSHVRSDRQQGLGLAGALVVTSPDDPPVAVDQVILLQEWRVTDGYTFPSMPMEGLFPNWFTINGKSWPSTPVVSAKVGDVLRFRFVGAGSFEHPMHIHGGPFTIVATDGNPVPDAARLVKDTVAVSPGERYDVLWTARRSGRWLLHCHINHHLTNDGAEVDSAGGLTMRIDVT